MTRDEELLVAALIAVVMWSVPGTHPAVGRIRRMGLQSGQRAILKLLVGQADGVVARRLKMLNRLVDSVEWHAAGQPETPPLKPSDDGLKVAA